MIIQMLEYKRYFVAPMTFSDYGKVDMFKIDVEICHKNF